MIDELSIVFHAFAIQMLTPLSVDIAAELYDVVY